MHDGDGFNVSTPSPDEPDRPMGQPFRPDPDRSTSSGPAGEGTPATCGMTSSNSHEPSAPRVTLDPEGRGTYPAWSTAPSDSAREDLGHAGQALKAGPMAPPVARSYEETFSREGDDWRRRLQTAVFSATPPADSRPPNGHEGGLPVEDGPETRGLARCERGVEENRSPQDGGVISPPRTEDKKLAVASGTEYCKHAGCTRTPRYGLKNGPLTLCQSHKRAGLYTVRDGVLLVATRDGSAFRETDGSISSANNGKVGTAARGSGETHRDAARDSAPTPATTAPSGSQGPKLPSSTTTAARRKCEAPDCTVQPSYGDPGTSRPRFCSSHKEKQMVSLKNRPCLFPGCDIRPHYGLSMGRPVYCVSHKKDGMVHLLKEAKNLEKEELKRKRRECGEVEKDLATGDSGHDGEEQAGSAEGSQQQRKKKKKKAPKREGTKCPSGSHGKPTNKKRSKNTAASSSHLRTAGQSALAPSDDVRLLQKARQSAYQEARGSGRRARVPSRKVLEASGKMADETAQWMTKEKKEEQARINKKFRAQRKAAAAAGLKIGEVIEATSSPAPRVESEEEGLEICATSIRGGGSPVSNLSWRKLAPTEILLAAGKKPFIQGAASEVRGNDATVAETTDKQAVGEQLERAPVASDDGDRSERKPAETTASGAEMSSQEDSTTTNVFKESSLEHYKKNQVEHSRAPSESEKGRYRVQQAGRQTRAVKAICELDSCSRTAKFGVHGIVRYCSRHRIFGMHKIVGVKKKA
ncbi:unnamed protein product [Ectocarpus sp. 12 AP-2014]